MASSDEPFTDGLTEELINALSRWRSFPVIARNSVFAHRGRDIDVRVIGRDLGARYIVSGSVQRQGERVRVNLDLVDVETAENLLSEQHEHASADPFALQDELVSAIAGVLAPEVLKLERERAVLRPPTEAGVYDLYERGMWHRYRNTREDLEAAEALFRQALEIDPGYARATAALSLCRNFAAISRWVPDVRAAFAESLTLARRAVADDPRDPHAHFALGVACMNERRMPEAIAELREAIRLNPSHAFAHANLGQVFNYLNQPDDGLAEVELALRLNPHDPRRFMWLPLSGCEPLSAPAVTRSASRFANRPWWQTPVIRLPYATWLRRWASLAWRRRLSRCCRCCARSMADTPERRQCGVACSCPKLRTTCSRDAVAPVSPDRGCRLSLAAAIPAGVGRELQLADRHVGSLHQDRRRYAALDRQQIGDRGAVRPLADDARELRRRNSGRTDGQPFEQRIRRLFAAWQLAHHLGCQPDRFAAGQQDIGERLTCLGRRDFDGRVVCPGRRGDGYRGSAGSKPDQQERGTSGTAEMRAFVRHVMRSPVLLQTQWDFGDRCKA